MRYFYYSISIILIGNSALAASDCYRSAKDMKPHLHSIVTKIAALHSSCNVDSDCTYEPNAGGFVAAKSEVYKVKDCFKQVSRALCEGSLNPKNGNAIYTMERPFKELDMPLFLESPGQIKCMAKRCKGTNFGSKEKWSTTWQEIDNKFRAVSDECFVYVKNPMKDFEK